jgi:hypothetical protein
MVKAPLKNSGWGSTDNLEGDDDLDYQFREDKLPIVFKPKRKANNCLLSYLRKYNY